MCSLLLLLLSTVKEKKVLDWHNKHLIYAYQSIKPTEYVNERNA